MNWVQVGVLEDIPRQGSRLINTSNGEIALFRTLDDQVFALNNRCPHKGGPLSEGIVHGHRVTCPLHSWVIDLASGEAIAPDKGCAHRHEVRVAHGVLFLETAGVFPAQLRGGAPSCRVKVQSGSCKA